MYLLNKRPSFVMQAVFDFPFCYCLLYPDPYLCSEWVASSNGLEFIQKVNFRCKVLSLLEACFDLILGSSMKIQIMGGKMTENLGFKSLLRKVKICLSFFSFSFQILHKKLVIFVFNPFWISCFTNQISIKSKIFNMFYLIVN